MGTKIIRKLTMATAFGDKVKVLEAALKGRVGDAPEGSPVDLLAVIGRVSSIKPGSVKRTMPDGTEMSSDYVKLYGNFEATNLQTGEITPDVGECILPNFVAASIAGAIKGGAVSVDFAVKLQARFKIAAATSYEFMAESLLPVQNADSVSDIKNRMLALGVEVPKMMQLAAPAPKDLAAAPAAAPAAEPEKAPKGSKK